MSRTDAKNWLNFQFRLLGVIFLQNCIPLQKSWIEARVNIRSKEKNMNIGVLLHQYYHSHLFIWVEMF